MQGIWIRSQDECKMVFTKSVEAWKDGRLVARFGKDFSVLGQFENQHDAKMIVGKICRFIQGRTKDNMLEVFNIPLSNKMQGVNK